MICVLVFCALLFVMQTCPIQAADKLPSGVTSRLKKIADQMSKVETSLSENKANHNALEWAQNALQEIKSQYSANADAPEVRSAEERIEKGRSAIEKLESDKTAAKQEKENTEKSADLIAEEWAAKLEPYKADTQENSKGKYGAPMSDPNEIAALRPQYEEAKKVYGEFLATGIDKDSHWKLREAEYNIKVAIQNYESSSDRVYKSAEEDINQALSWLQQQKNLPQPNIHSTSRMKDMSEKVDGVRLLLPADSEKLQTINANFTEIQKLQAEIEKIILKKRKMKADVYKGKDAAKVKTLARSIVTKEEKQAKVLRVHVTSPTWQTESATEWTDTTQTAIQHRVTKGLFAQVALTKGSDCFLYTLFINKDRISGATGGLKGHIMFKDKFLKENLPK
jgi:hypothetical protein